MNSLKKTALITGASAGLGAEYARQLAGQGYDLILTARRADRLQALADELAAQYPVQIEIWPADLLNEADIQRLEQQIAGRPDLALLVNNAGFGQRGRFAETPIQKQLDMIQVHVLASVRLARAILPVLLARRSGGIINVSSMSAFIPIRNTTYSATKAYLVNFSEALQTELLGHGVNVQALCPGFTHTEFHDTSELSDFKRSSIPAWLWLRSEKVVADSLRALPKGHVVCIPGLQYQVAAAFVRTPITRSLIMTVARWLLSRRGEQN